MNDSLGRRAHTELPDATPHDPATDGPHVLAAFNAVAELVGADCPRRSALSTLAELPEYHTLTPQETVAVLLRFPGRGDR